MNDYFVNITQTIGLEQFQFDHANNLFEDHRSVETGLERGMLVVAVISVNGYPFLAFSDLTCHHDEMGIGVFWLHCAT